MTSEVLQLAWGLKLEPPVFVLAMMHTYRLLHVVALSALAAGCISNAPPATLTGTPLISPVSPATNSTQLSPLVPETGLASLSGVIRMSSTGAAIPNTLVYLIPAREDGSPPILLTEQDGISAETDARGRVIFSSVPPGTYFIAVWAPYSRAFVVESPNSNALLKITLKPNEVLELGDLYAPWP